MKKKHRPAATPRPPYYAVIFTSARTDGDDGYIVGAQAVDAGFRAIRVPGVLTRPTETGCFRFIRASLEAIKAWEEYPSRRQVQRKAKEWYQSFCVRVCRSEREYGFLFLRFI